MCGIAGIWRFKTKASADEIRSFTDSMYHRGPDGAGYEVFENDNLALGHRRLSILDLTSAGQQPMSYANERYWLTFNGEIYNFIEIRKELSAMGYGFASDTDSEVILAAYIAWGKACFKKFNGMWAIGIWDSHEKQLLLCRDRFGVKPLHYCFVPGNFFAFASETVAFRHLDGYRRSYHENNLLRTMHAHNLLEPAGDTIYNDIHQLLPGSYMLIRKDRIAEKSVWWHVLDHLPQIPKDFESQKQQFLELLSDACKLRLRSDVPVASALSGGIDSTAVYCMLAHVMKNNGDGRVPKDWQKAFSIAFPGSEVDERTYIESVLRQTNGNGTIVEPANDNIVAELEKSTLMSDLISGTPLSCLTYVYKAMHASGIVVSMDGHGVDEYLYGYTSSVRAALINAYVNGKEDDARQIEHTLIGMGKGDTMQNLVNSARQKAAQLKGSKRSSGGLKNMLKSLLPRKEYYTIYGFEGGTLYHHRNIDAQSYPEVPSVYHKNHNLGEQQLLEEFQYIDLPYNLRDFDRGAMQHQIEIRMPFLDYRLVSYTMALPQSSKLNNGYTKYILRESMKGIMPEDIRTRKLKIGLGAPVTDWFNGPLNSYLMDLASSQKLAGTSFLNGGLVKEIIQDLSWRKAWTDAASQQIWPIINYLLLSEN